jgi:hypothetical protein
MVRTLVCAVAALVFFAGSIKADEIKGKVKHVDTAKHTVTVVTADGQEHVIKLQRGAKITGSDGKEVSDGLKSVKEGTEVDITTEKKDGHQVGLHMKLQNRVAE